MTCVIFLYFGAWKTSSKCFAVGGIRTHDPSLRISSSYLLSNGGDNKCIAIVFDLDLEEALIDNLTSSLKLIDQNSADGPIKLINSLFYILIKMKIRNTNCSTVLSVRDWRYSIWPLYYAKSILTLKNFK